MNSIYLAQEWELVVLSVKTGRMFGFCEGWGKVLYNSATISFSEKTVLHQVVYFRLLLVKSTMIRDLLTNHTHISLSLCVF